MMGLFVWNMRSDAVRVMNYLQLAAAAASPSPVVDHLPGCADSGGFDRVSRPAVPAGRRKEQNATDATTAAVGSVNIAEMCQNATAAESPTGTAALSENERVSRLQ
jgi:hypothetical protein